MVGIGVRQAVEGQRKPTSVDLQVRMMRRATRGASGWIIRQFHESGSS